MKDQYGLNFEDLEKVKTWNEWDQQYT